MKEIMDTQLFSVLSTIFGFIITLLMGMITFFLKDVFQRLVKVEQSNELLKQQLLILQGEFKRLEAVNTQILQHINDKLEAIEEALKNHRK